MKQKFLTYVIPLLIGATLFISCSKEDAIVNSSQSTRINATGKAAPSYMNGSVSGTFDPVPQAAYIQVHTETTLWGQTYAENGSFYIDYLPAGEYTVTIRYTLTNGGEEKTMILPGIIVKDYQTTNLGTIRLQ